VLGEDVEEIAVDYQTTRNSGPRVDDDRERGVVGELQCEEGRESVSVGLKTRKDASSHSPPRSSFSERPW